MAALPMAEPRRCQWSESYRPVWERMIGNPLQHPLLAPVAVAVGLLFLAGLLAILIATKGNLQKTASSSLFLRWRTWAFIAPIYVLAVLSGPLPTLLLAMGLALQGIREYARLVKLPTLYGRVLICMTLAILPTSLASFDLYLALPPLLLILGTLQPLLTQNVESGGRHLAFAALGFGYLPWLLGFLVLIPTRLSGGDGLLLVLALGIALSDIGAFVMGSLFGRHRLSPTLSPSKTWEGTLGNLFGASLGTAILWFALPDWMPTSARVGVPLLISVAAIWGDLVESLLKREFAVKDAGAWLPGFGGLLDRIDSLLLAVPLTFYYAVGIRWLSERI
jgi:phosphatidate cytidylyltransferase